MSYKSSIKRMFPIIYMQFIIIIHDFNQYNIENFLTDAEQAIYYNN